MIVNPNDPLSTPKKQVDFSTAKDLNCECGNPTFLAVTKFKRISAIASPTGREALIPFEVYTCTQCGAIPAELDINIPSNG